MKLSEHFEDYARFHKNPTNKIFHSLGIPMIMLSLFGLLGLISTQFETSWGYVRVDAAILLWAFGSFWYLQLDRRIGLLFGLVALAMYGVSGFIPVPVHIALFVIGWFFQLWGHKKYEKNSPAFLKNIQHFLIGPLWIFCQWTGLKPSN